MSVTKSVAELAGARARELRGNSTLEDVATAARSYGLRWSTGSVSDFESGRTAPNLSTLLVVAAALGDITGKPVPLTDLFPGGGFVAINDSLSIAASKLRAALSGQPPRLMALKPPPSAAALRRAQAAATLVATGKPAGAVAVLQNFRESDARMCKNIGVSLDDGAAAMAKLWGQPFTAQRDQLAGPDANPQRRGRVSRQLKAELLNVVQGKESK